MWQTALAVISAGVVLLVALPAAAPRTDDQNRGILPEKERNVPVAIPGSYFYPAIAEYPAGEGQALEMEVCGAIVPHHALASAAIAQSFARLVRSAPDIETFIILGPNHVNRGRSEVISCRANWRTALGDVSSDYGLLDAWEKEHLIAFQDENCITDQAVLTLVPFIAHYFPDAKVAPLLFSSEETRPEALFFAAEMAKAASSTTFILASLDFSHYLSRERAEENDLFTAAAIARKDYAAISRLGSDYVDSPAALIVFLRAMESAGATRSETLYHGNSAEYPGEGDLHTTSYFSVIYGK